MGDVDIQGCSYVTLLSVERHIEAGSSCFKRVVESFPLRLELVIRREIKFAGKL